MIEMLLSPSSRRIGLHKGCLTQRAPDWWDSARFQAVSVAQSGFRQMAVSRLAHQRVTPTVRQPKSKNK